MREGGCRRSQMRIPFYILLAPLSQLDVIFDLIRRSRSHTSGGHFSFHPLYYTKYNMHKLYIYFNIIFSFILYEIRECAYDMCRERKLLRPQRYAVFSLWGWKKNG